MWIFDTGEQMESNGNTAESLLAARDKARAVLAEAEQAILDHTATLRAQLKTLGAPATAPVGRPRKRLTAKRTVAAGSPALDKALDTLLGKNAAPAEMGDHD